jgi:hypothetical protein
VAFLRPRILLDLVFWILAAVLRTSVQTTLGQMLLLLGLLGPMLGGIGFTYLTQDKESFFSRLPALALSAGPNLGRFSISGQA